MPIFSVAELLDVAIKDEETGIAFYEALADVTKDPTVAEHLRHIAQQERHHKQRFTEMLKDVGAYKPQERYVGEYESYLRAVLDSRAFPEPAVAADEARRTSSDADAIATAIRLEKDALLFLREIKQFLPPTHVEYVEAVIREEQEHLIELTELRKRTRKK